MELERNTAPQYFELIQRIGQLLEQGRRAAAQSVNSIMVQTYWEIGRHIVEFEQQGNIKSEYGSDVFVSLSRDLTETYGKGFGRSNLVYIRKLYLLYAISGTLSDQLGWSQYYELLKIDDPLEPSFYEKQCALERWSVRELKRRKEAMLFHRLALSRDKEGILELAKSGQILEKPEDLLRDTYVLEFLSIPEPYHVAESDLEERLIGQLQQFLLELGKGFAFIGRQYRITLGNRHHYVDLVFYHRILKCFVLIDLKSNEAGHADVGQMNMYLAYFEEEENTEGDNLPIGIVLAREKDEVVVRYALKNISSKLFIGKYQLYLPNREELQQKLEEILSKNQAS